jgi:hypothetical protein
LTAWVHMPSPRESALNNHRPSLVMAKPSTLEEFELDVAPPGRLYVTVCATLFSDPSGRVVITQPHEDRPAPYMLNGGDLDAYIDVSPVLPPLPLH